MQSIHHPDAGFIGVGFGLEIIANDYMITPSGSKHLLEVNHIPNVTRFPEIWETYWRYVVACINQNE